MTNLNTKQVIAIIMAVLGVVAMASAQLVDMGASTAVAKSVTTAAGFVNTILAAVVAAISGQASMVKEVAAMPGVESIKVNDQANQVLAAVAVDPKIENVESIDKRTENVVQQTAKGE